MELIEKNLLGAEFLPLTLTYMCVIYRKYGRLFNSRRELYNRIIDLMLEEWDNQRQVRRASAFEKFDSYDKKRFLRQLSYRLTTEVGGYYFSTGTVRKFFEGIVADYDGLRKKDFFEVFQEIETHTGLFVKAGDGYMFSHRTIQEYLCAVYLYEFPEVPASLELLHRMPNELALATSFNENASLYLSYLILNRFNTEGAYFFKGTFFSVYFDRLAIEQPNFKIHGYLGLSVLVMFTNFLSDNYEPDVVSHHDKLISKFFSFIDIDDKVKKSIELLADMYRIERQIPEKGVFVLTKREEIVHGRLQFAQVDANLRYSEPEKLLSPYHFFGVFSD